MNLGPGVTPYLHLKFFFYYGIHRSEIFEHQTSFDKAQIPTSVPIFFSRQPLHFARSRQVIPLTQVASY